MNDDRLEPGAKGPKPSSEEKAALSIEQRVRAAIELLLGHPSLRVLSVRPPRLLRNLLPPMHELYAGEKAVNDNAAGWISEVEDSGSGA